MTLDERRTREELISELNMMRDRVACLESLLPDRNDPALRHDFQGLFDAFDTPVSLLDTNFRFQAVNSAYEEYLGVARETLIGRTPAAIVGEEVFRKDVLDKLQR
jgi:PAS domain-containing protein